MHTENVTHTLKPRKVRQPQLQNLSISNSYVMNQRKSQTKCRLLQPFWPLSKIPKNNKRN